MSWYIAIPERSHHGMEDTRDIDGLYIKGRILPAGSMVPMEWKGRQAIQDLYLPANYLEAYSPTAEDWPILHMLWPSLRPNDFQAEFVDNSRLGKHGAWASGWYQVQEPDRRRRMTSVPYGIAALCDIEGVCKAGDVALAGDIVPAPFFAGLNFAQLERLETIGLCSQTWLNALDRDIRGVYMREFARPAIQRVAVSAEQKLALYAKFPALDPNQVQTLNTVKSTKRKA